ncbi:MAG: GNAT family N-acetyltransferase [Acidimicrobiia bacterium]|nr:GNAT family N-acetyltransferase [Acidimicrobiia bacterium]NNF63465.1 GNAT family N-acetyltransferase [Acidimicrobiia bacterium]
MPRMLPTYERRTPRLVLRPFRRRDADPMVESIQASLPDLRKWLPWAVGGYTRIDAIRYVRESVNAWNEHRAYDFAIRQPSDPDRHLGNVSIWWTSRQGAVGEIGYWLRSDEASKGFMTEAVAGMLRVGFEELTMHRIVLRIAVGNRASERVAEKLGFVLEGTLRDEVRVGDEWLDHTIWSMLSHEYDVHVDRFRAETWI